MADERRERHRGRPQRLPMRRLPQLAHGPRPAIGTARTVAGALPLTPFAAWDPQQGLCPECGFDWDETDYEDLVGQCVHGVAVFGEVLSRIDPAAEVQPGLWSASRYVWHTVDVLRMGTERLWTISADPAFGVPAFDENVMADTRSYDSSPPSSG